MKQASPYVVGQIVGAVSARYTAARTAPPDRYDMATILDVMLAAHRFAKTEADRKVLQSIGIGTSRTRLAIVQGLVDKGLLSVERKGKRHVLRPTAFGEELCAKLPPLLLDVALTAKWEVAFGMVERGEVTSEQLVDRTYQLVDQVLALAKQQLEAGFTSVAKQETKPGHGRVVSPTVLASKTAARGASGVAR